MGIIANNPSSVPFLGTGFNFNPPAPAPSTLLNSISRGVPKGRGFPDGRPLGQPFNPPWLPPGAEHDFNPDTINLAQGNTAPPDYFQELMAMMSPQSQAWASGQPQQFTPFQNMQQPPLPGSPEWIQERNIFRGILP